VCEESLSDEEQEPIYQHKKSTALQRQALRIGAVPMTEPIQNFVYLTTFTTTLSTWSSLLLNGLQLGTGASNRIGRQIFMTYMQWKASTTLPSRLLLIYDSQSNGAAPAITDILQDSTDVVNSPHSFQGRERFHYIFDSAYDLTPERNTNYTHKHMPINLSTSYNDGNTGTIADITSGALYMWAYTSSSTFISIALNLFYEE